MVVLLQRLLEDGQEIRKVVLVGNRQIGSQIIDDRDAAEPLRRIQRLRKGKESGKQFGPLRLIPTHKYYSTGI